MRLTEALKEYLQDRRDPRVSWPSIDDLATVAAERGWKYEEVYPATIQTCPSAKGLSEDFLRWVHEGPRLLKMHRDARRGMHFPHHWAGSLHSTTRYRMDKVLRCAIPGAAVSPSGGGVLSDRNEWIKEAYFISAPPRKSQVPAVEPKTREGRYISLLTIWGEKNMGHYFFDAMLRVTLFENLADYKFLVPAYLHPWHKGLYEVAGIKEEQWVPIEAPWIRVEELNVTHTSNSGSKPRAELLLKFRDLALKNTGSLAPARRDRRIFVDRSGAKRRKMAKQDELLPVLKERGFEIIRWEDYSIAEQVRIASETNVMIGPHGTSLLNSLYCQPGAKLLEIFNPAWWDTTTLRQCCLAGHDFWYTFGENVSSEYDTVIDPKKLARVLDYMLETDGWDPSPEELSR